MTKRLIPGRLGAGENELITDKKFSEILALLISNTSVIEEQELEEAIQHAEALDIPLDKALTMSGVVSAADIQGPLKATKLVQQGNLSVEQAVSAMRLIVHQKMTPEAAFEAVKAHNETKPPRPPIAVTSEIGQLLVEAQIISSQQLEDATQKAQQAAVPVGRMLKLNRDITTSLLNSVINGQILLQDKKSTREDVIDALRNAHRKNTSIEQALFEMGKYKQPGDNELKLSDLLAMAGLISESDRLECLELEVVRKKPLGQILKDQGLVSQDMLESAVHLQGTVATDTVHAYEAAEALSRLATEKISVYQALAELKARESVPPMRLGDLLVAAEFASMKQIESAVHQSHDSNIKVGKVLLQAGIISETRLFNGLRCQSLVKFGFLSDAQAIAALRAAERHKGSLEAAFTQMEMYAPSSMQWSWV